LAPSTHIGLTDRIEYFYIGMLMMGFNLSLSMVPTLAELIEILTKKQKYREDDISDLTIGIFNSMYSLGNLFAPLFGGILSVNFTYN
jgi:MFS family permease